MKNLAVLLLVLVTAGTTLKAQDEPMRIVSVGSTIANVYLLDFGEKKMLVDIGLNSSAEKLEKRIRRKGIAPASIDYLLLTHGHSDHAGATKYFQQKFGIKVIAGAGDTALYHSGHNNEIRTTSKLAVWIAKHVVKEHDFPAFHPDILVDDQMDLRSLGIPGTVEVLPGHSDGSMVLVIGEKAFVGDMIRGALLAGHRPRRHFFHLNTTQAESHLEPLLEAGIATFYLGHKGTLSAKRVRKYLDKTKASTADQD